LHYILLRNHDHIFERFDEEPDFDREARPESIVGIVKDRLEVGRRAFDTGRGFVDPMRSCVVKRIKELLKPITG
jgi:hypothetical protein